MKRYFYEEGSVHCGEAEVDHITDVTDENGFYTETDKRTEIVDLYAEGYCVFDRLRGHIDDRAIAVCNDRDDAEKIVDALNAMVAS